MRIIPSALVLSVVLGLACAPAPPAEAPPAHPGVFTFAPVVGRTYRHVMTRHEEMAIVGAPIREAQDAELTWEMKVEQESNLIRIRADLRGLKLSHNGAQALSGSEIEPAKAFVQILMDRDGKIVDVRHTDTISEAIAALALPEARESIRSYLSPENLRFYLIGLVQERTVDLLGHPSRVGESWLGEASPEEAAAAQRKLTVQAAKPCGQESCVFVQRETAVNPELVWAAARARVDAFVKARGGNPAQVALQNAKIELEDEFLVNPSTLEFHHALFAQKAELTVGTAEGPLTVRFTTNRESKYEY